MEWKRSPERKPVSLVLHFRDSRADNFSSPKYCLEGAHHLYEFFFKISVESGRLLRNGWARVSGVGERPLLTLPTVTLCIQSQF